MMSATPIGMTPIDWLASDLSSQLNAMLNGSSTPQARDLTEGALTALLVSQDEKEACATARALMRRFGDRFDMSFGGLCVPALVYGWFDTCFDAKTHGSDRINFIEAINASLPQRDTEATTQDVAYTNMYLMAAVTTLLFGEMATAIATTYQPHGDLPTLRRRAATTTAVGYKLLAQWLSFTANGGIHEFTSPTYSHVQLNALYMGYLYSRRDGARAHFGRSLDYLWSELMASYLPASGTLTGPHSRDYDFLLGHGMVDIDYYTQRTAGGDALHARQPRCAFHDPHCEGTPRSWMKGIGTGEPSMDMSITLLNLLRPDGYRVHENMLRWARAPSRVVTSCFLPPGRTANGRQGRFADTYNYLVATADGGGFAVGSASQDYSTRVHSPYAPYPGEELVHIRLCPPLNSSLSCRATSDSHRPATPAITIQPDFADSPYGLSARYPLWAGIDKGAHLAMHPGIVQDRGTLLATHALNTWDATDGFHTSPLGNTSGFLSIASTIILPSRVTSAVWIGYPNGTVSALHLPLGDRAQREEEGEGRRRKENEGDGRRRAQGEGEGEDGAAPRSFDVPLPFGSTVGIRLGSAAMAVKIFDADGIDEPPRLSLRGVPEGLGLNAMALTCQHYGPAKPGAAARYVHATHVRFAALALIDTAPTDAALANLTRRALHTITTSSVGLANDSTTRQWTVKAHDSSTSLVVRHNMSCAEAGSTAPGHTPWDCLLDRAINGSTVQAGTLTVNGEAVPTPTLLGRGIGT